MVKWQKLPRPDATRQVCRMTCSTSTGEHMLAGWELIKHILTILLHHGAIGVPHTL